MKKILMIIAALLAAAVIAVMLAGWWYLRSEKVEQPDLPGAVEVGSLLHNDLRRSWRTYVPAAKSEKPALLLLLHGSRGNGERMRASTTFYSFDVLAEREGFIAVYPDGYQQHWNDCRAGADYAANLENIDDVGFLSTLVQLMAADQGVDLARVYVAGMSNGGHMAYRLGLEAPQLVAGIAAVAANMPVDANLDCERSGRPVSVMIMNGTADPVNPYNGGVVKIAGNTSRGDVMSSVATADYWAALAGYENESQSQVWPQRAPDDGTSVESTRWAGQGKPPVQLISIRGGGHTVPNPVFSLPRILGATSHQLDGAEVIWSFFEDSAGP
jgi:polyhydroxybutyrate depolymerase